MCCGKKKKLLLNYIILIKHFVGMGQFRFNYYIVYMTVFIFVWIIISSYLYRRYNFSLLSIKKKISITLKLNEHSLCQKKNNKKKSLHSQEIILFWVNQMHGQSSCLLAQVKLNYWKYTVKMMSSKTYCIIEIAIKFCNLIWEYCLVEIAIKNLQLKLRKAKYMGNQTKGLDLLQHQQ